MMTPEERQRFKEEEKAHLRKLKALRAAARRRRSSAVVTERLADMAEGMRHTLDTHGEFMDKLDRETASHEARVEIALEGQPTVPDSVSEQQRADALVTQLRTELESTSAVSDTSNAATETEHAPTPKTIGRMPGDLTD